MDDEKMLRAVVAGHVYAAMLAQEREARPPDELVSYSDIAREVVIATDALLVELKKNSPAPAPESAPPLADEAPIAGDVPQCEAYGCAARGIYSYEFAHRVVGRFCKLHVDVRPESILLEWHRHAMKARAA